MIGNFGLIDRDTPKEAYTKKPYYAGTAFFQFGSTNPQDSTLQMILNGSLSLVTSSTLTDARSTLAMTPIGRQTISTIGVYVYLRGR
jgi:hypothetical protein